jgi:Cft2 family RNA processing exonuclease
VCAVQVHAENAQVLIPVFALGRAQELCILLDTYWERMNLTVPIYFSAGLTEKANYYYKLFIPWTNEKIKNTFVDRFASCADFSLNFGLQEHVRLQAHRTV